MKASISFNTKYPEVPRTHEHTGMVLTLQVCHPSIMMSWNKRCSTGHVQYDS